MSFARLIINIHVYAFVIQYKQKISVYLNIIIYLGKHKFVELNLIYHSLNTSESCKINVDFARGLDVKNENILNMWFQTTPRLKMRLIQLNNHSIALCKQSDDNE